MRTNQTDRTDHAGPVELVVCWVLLLGGSWGLLWLLAVLVSLAGGL